MSGNFKRSIGCRCCTPTNYLRVKGCGNRGYLEGALVTAKDHTGTRTVATGPSDADGYFYFFGEGSDAPFKGSATFTECGHSWVSTPYLFPLDKTITVPIWEGDESYPGSVAVSAACATARSVAPINVDVTYTDQCGNVTTTTRTTDSDAQFEMSFFGGTYELRAYAPPEFAETSLHDYTPSDQGTLWGEYKYSHVKFNVNGCGPFANAELRLEPANGYSFIAWCPPTCNGFPVNNAFVLNEPFFGITCALTPRAVTIGSTLAVPDYWEGYCTVDYPTCVQGGPFTCPARSGVSVHYLLFNPASGPPQLNIFYGVPSGTVTDCPYHENGITLPVDVSSISCDPLLLTFPSPGMWGGFGYCAGTSPYSITITN